MNSMNPNQSSKYDDQPKPPSGKTKESQDSAAQKYVVLPHHPLYGCLVTIIRRQVATTYVKCTIENPAHPGFRYQIREYWLSSIQPPSLPISPIGKLPSLSLKKGTGRRPTPIFSKETALCVILSHILVQRLKPGGQFMP